MYGVPVKESAAKVPSLPVNQLNNASNNNDGRASKITTNTDDDFDFSSDDDEDTNKYTRHMDAPPCLPDVCVLDYCD